MSTRATEIESEICTWPGIVSESERFGCREFSLGMREVGRLHGGSQVEIPFPKAVRDVLIESGLVKIHDRYPDSGWITFDVEDGRDVDRAIDLFRLSYLYELGVLQERGVDNQELSLLDVERELEELSLPVAARDAVTRAVSDRRSDERRTERTGENESESEGKDENGNDDGAEDGDEETRPATDLLEAGSDAEPPNERYRSRLEAEERSTGAGPQRS